jgi:sulfoxide reductase heme-binding subunit YedZ
MRRLSDAVQRLLQSRVFYPAVFLGCLWPGLVLIRRTFQGDLGVNPVETLLHETGRTALTLLLVALTITPIRRLTGWNRVQRVRRLIGVWSFAYAFLHFTTYVVFNHMGDLSAIWSDVTERPFIFMGMLALVILTLLAITSTNGMIRRLGRRWQQLHRLAYVAACAGVVHFIWGQKADIREPLWWAAFLAILLGLRVVFAWRKRRSRAVPVVSH